MDPANYHTLQPGQLVDVTIRRARVVGLVDNLAYLTVEIACNGGVDTVHLPVTTFDVEVRPVAPPEFDDLYPGDVYRAITGGDLFMWRLVSHGQPGFVSATDSGTFISKRDILYRFGPLERVYAAPRPADPDDEAASPHE